MADNINPVLGNMAKDPKATEDFSKETEEIIGKAEGMRVAGRLDEAIEELMTLEKKTRTASDGISTAKLLVKICQLLYAAKEWPKLHEHIVLLSKKRGQLKRAITDMIQLCMGWLPDLDKATKLELIATLNEVTKGKIFVEVEQARLTKMEARMKEEEGDIEAAANLMQEVQVETFGAMERREKTEYILDQMRLVLLKKDFVRTQIIGKKINPKLLETVDFQDLKIQFYEYMVRYWLHEGNCLEVSKCYLAMFRTPIVQFEESWTEKGVEFLKSEGMFETRGKPSALSPVKPEDKEHLMKNNHWEKAVKDGCVQVNGSKGWKDALTAHVLYLLLSKYDNEQADMVQRIYNLESKKLDKIPVFKALLKIFMTNALAPWPLPAEPEFKAHPVFQEVPHEGAAARWDMLKKRVVQHNIKTIANYYENIHTSRLCELIGLNEKEAEAELSEMVCDKFVFAKIDRPAGAIKFGQKETYTDRLNDWSGSIGKMLDLLDGTCHLIHKEQMVHDARKKLKK